MVAAAGLPEQVIGVALLNSAGQFGNPNSEAEKSEEETALQRFILKPLKQIFQRVILGFLFWQAKQPARVESVLKSVSLLLVFSLKAENISSLVCKTNELASFSTILATNLTDIRAVSSQSTVYCKSPLTLLQSL